MSVCVFVFAVPKSRIVTLLLNNSKPVSCLSHGHSLLLKRTASDGAQDHEGDVQKNSEFQFSKSSNYPQKVDLLDNLYPSHNKNSSKYRKLFSKFFAVALPISLFYFLYCAFTSDYDLELEEKLMESLPGYEQSMSANKKYVESIERLRKKRDEAKGEKH